MLFILLVRQAGRTRLRVFGAALKTLLIEYGSVSINFIRMLDHDTQSENEPRLWHPVHFVGHDLHALFPGRIDLPFHWASR